MSRETDELPAVFSRIGKQERDFGETTRLQVVIVTTEMGRSLVTANVIVGEG